MCSAETHSPHGTLLLLDFAIALNDGFESTLKSNFYSSKEVNPSTF